MSYPILPEAPFFLYKTKKHYFSDEGRLDKEEFKKNKNKKN